jgi:hypothetical protein
VNLRSTIALVLALAGLTLTAAACSASVSTGSSATPGGSQTYTNDQYRFSLTYDTLFTEGTSSGGTESGSGSVFDIAFADTSGTKIAGKYIDGIQVSVYELARSVKPSEVAGLKTEFKNLVTELMGSLGEAKTTTPLSLTEVNGVPGFTFSYSYTEDSVPITATTYFLIKGQTEYQVTEQAGQDTWATLEPKLQAAVDSFTVK